MSDGDIFERAHNEIQEFYRITGNRPTHIYFGHKEWGKVYDFAHDNRSTTVIQMLPDGGKLFLGMNAHSVDESSHLRVS